MFLYLYLYLYCFLDGLTTTLIHLTLPICIYPPSSRLITTLIPTLIDNSIIINFTRAQLPPNSFARHPILARDPPREGPCAGGRYRRA